MSFSHIIQSAVKIFAKRYAYKAGKNIVRNPGKTGMAAGALIVGGVLAYQLMHCRKSGAKKAKNKITTGRHKIVV